MHEARDRDLLSSDTYLTDTALDQLWDWFCNANMKQMDPQFIFVKLVNTARNPYKDQLESRPFGAGSSYAPSESVACATEDTASTVAPDEVLIDLDEVLRNSQAQEKHTDNIGACDCGASQAKDTSTANANTTPEGFSRPLPISPTRVAIKSSAFPNSYVQLNGEFVDSYVSGGAGTVRVSGEVSAREAFELERHTDGTVAFKSTSFPNVYLRADALGLAEGNWRWFGGGVINCQYSCGANEKFRIHKIGSGGEVAIEPAAFPGRYLRVNGMNPEGINLQAVRTGWEKFFLVLVL
ncbi:hypothetical protein BDZ91DRAFT_767322 [Kalaharituber pfeilii]|nr:hypothetical protein BDZ91DRAFT_767322 [Kalaharituber pfeilii]